MTDKPDYRKLAMKLFSDAYDLWNEDDDNYSKAIEHALLDADRKGYEKGIEDSAKRVDGMDIDEDRCRKLQLTEQAWEEALQAASKEIRKFGEKKC